jgi:hypothetical protein
MIQTLVSATTFLAALASTLAACFWYRAAQVESPPDMLLGSSGLRSAAIPNAPDSFVDATPLVKYARESGQRNKLAALCSAAAAFFAGLAAALGTYVSWTGC